MFSFSEQTSSESNFAARCMGHGWCAFTPNHNKDQCSLRISTTVFALIEGKPLYHAPNLNISSK